MEVDVAVKYAEQIAGIDRPAVLALQGLEPFDVTLRHRKRQDAHRHDLKFFAHAVYLRHLSGAEVTHDGAAIGDALDDPLLLQFEKRQPDVAAMRVEVDAQILLDEAFARMAPA